MSTSTRSPISPDTVETTATPDWTVQIAEVLTEATGSSHGSVRPAAEVPFAAVHLWHAGAVADLIGAAVARRGGDRAPHEALRTLHERAAAGETFGEGAWSAALEPALREVYRLAYPREKVHTTAAAAASSFALSRGWAEKDAEEYGETYARMNTEVSERVHAEANTIANTAAYALAFATAEAEDYARAWPFALVRACVAAYAGADGTGGPDGQEARTRLRDGLVDAMGRVGA
ncbi:SpcZ [Streptomyces sp. NBC_01455]|uniref:SpcZ n=1 Tax=Streptomyces sp. NBC_01455 TaxID=2903874 RepID=UPI002E3128A8|nr:SpcZ [Streptomyces sp. NBC_01455]